MYKNLALLALAVVSTAAMAADDGWMWRDPSTNSWNQNEMWVQQRADNVIAGADAYTISQIFDRAPSNVAMALANSLARNTWQSKMMGDEIAWSRVPERTTYVTTYTNPDGSMTTTSTTTTEWTLQARPMRMIMEMKPRMITYDDELEIITSNLTDSEATAFRQWYWNSATNGEKDAIMAYLEANAKIADRWIYPSSLRRRDMN
jgi:hypothetical protein